MVMSILVSGLLPYNSGKTYFTASLARGLKSVGLSVSVYKPVSAHSVWYQFKSFMESLRLGVLVGEDVLNYMKLGLIKDPDVQNPIDILTAVPDISKYSSIDEYLKVLEDAISQAVLVRISHGIRRYFIIHDTLNYLNEYLRNQVLESVRALGHASRVSKLWLLNYLMSKEVDNILISSFSKIASLSDVILIESFSNALIPTAALSAFINALAIVAPGKALIFSGSKLRSYLSTVKSLIELDSRRFLKFFKPDLEVNIPLSEEWPPKKLSHDAIELILKLK